MNKPSKEKNQSLVSSVRIKEIDIKVLLSHITINYSAA